MGLRVSVLVEVHAHDGSFLIARVLREDLTFNASMAGDSMDLSAESSLAAAALATLSAEAIERTEEKLNEWSTAISNAIEDDDD